MKITVVTDIHGRGENLGLLPASDLTLICGDITHFAHAQKAEEILSHIKGNVFAIHGNCDHADVTELLEKKGISLHRTEREFRGIKIYGIGGGNKSPFGTPTEYSEDAIEKMLPKTRADILITHVPPKDCLDGVRFGTHIGSNAIRDYIETFKPSFAFCGHVHENRGQEKIGDTFVTNPGPFKEGFYAQVVWEKNWVELKKL